MGAGAIYAIIGVRLTGAGVDVTLLEQWPEHVEAILDEWEVERR